MRFIGIENADRLIWDIRPNLSSWGKFSWRSRDRFGGTNNYYETLKKRDSGARYARESPWREYIPQRIIIKDLEGEGIPKVIINKNEFLTGSFFQRLRVYETGAIYNLIWDENMLTINWKTREIKGYIADYQIKDVDNDGEEELVVAVVAPEEDVSGLLSQNPRSNILFFKLF